MITNHNDNNNKCGTCHNLINESFEYFAALGTGMLLLQLNVNSYQKIYISIT